MDKEHAKSNTTVEIAGPSGVGIKTSGDPHNIIIILLITILCASILGNGMLYTSFESCRADVARLEQDIMQLEGNINVLHNEIDSLHTVSEELSRLVATLALAKTDT